MAQVFHLVQLDRQSSNTDVSLLDEVFDANNGSDDAKFIHIKTASGQTGYIQGRQLPKLFE